MEPDETTKDLSSKNLITTTVIAEGATDSRGPGTRRSRRKSLSELGPGGGCGRGRRGGDGVAGGD